MKKLLLPALIVAAGSAANAQWTEQATGFTNQFRGINSIDIVDANTVWCVAYDGSGAGATIHEFTKTTDGGATWTPGAIDTGENNSNIIDMSAISGTTCFVAASDPDTGAGGVYRTQDEGLNWTNTTLGYYTSPTSWFDGMYMFDDMNGVCIGDPIGTGAGDFEVYYTNDSGDNWNPVPGAALPPPAGTVGGATAEYGYTGGNFGVGNSYWFVTNKGNIYHTADMGTTWNKITNAAGLTDFSSTSQGGDIHFSDAANGILIKRATVGTTNTYSLYHTIDAGSTWTQTAASYTTYLQVAYIPGTQTLVGTGASDPNDPTTYASAYSNDNGVTWNVIDTGVQRTAVAFYDPSTGWAGGFNDSDTAGGIYKYTGAALANHQVGPKALFTVSPNPTNGIVRVSNDSSNINEVLVYDLLGKQVFGQKFSAVSNADINLSSLTSGAYILKATAEGGASQTVKIVKN